MSAYKDFKEMEAARIQPLIAAVAALPGAALIIGDAGDTGAPLFLSAVVAIAGSYLMWMCSDAVFANSYEHHLSGGKKSANRIDVVGYYFSWATLIYGLASLMLSGFGFAALHSQLRVPVTVEQGFAATLVFFLFVAAQAIHSVHLRNKQVTVELEA